MVLSKKEDLWKQKKECSSKMIKLETDKDCIILEDNTDNTLEGGENVPVSKVPDKDIFKCTSISNEYMSKKYLLS